MIVAESEPARWQCTFSNGTVEATADTTDEHGGGGNGIRPHELLEAALATCLNMTVRMVAARREIDLDAVATAVDLDRESEAPTVRYTIDVAGVDDERAAELRAAASECPVKQTLGADLHFVDDCAPLE